MSPYRDESVYIPNDRQVVWPFTYVRAHYPHLAELLEAEHGALDPMAAILFSPSAAPRPMNAQDYDRLRAALPGAEPTTGSDN